ncbi:hypothetical protein TrVE_jg2670 [Triparma verrucosa]|uniref:WW domain-containing protein n=2 Tax=Triparma TaxID=722752 RepID=A0A9W7F0Q3_9STRA|nr:hypothetical protein TrVE_jg2670 [Triparma verrucosa]GMH96763.1 hypothetical protein TrST_g2183 [Triparma strigata]
MSSPVPSPVPPKFPSPATNRPISPRASDTLTSQWRSAVDPVTSRTYYYDYNTKAVTWKKPLELRTVDEIDEELSALKDKVLVRDAKLAERDKEVAFLTERIEERDTDDYSQVDFDKCLERTSPQIKPAPQASVKATQRGSVDKETWFTPTFDISTESLLTPSQMTQTSPARSVNRRNAVMPPTANSPEDTNLQAQYDTLSAASAALVAFIVTTLLALLKTLSDDLNADGFHLKQVFFVWCWISISFTVQDMIIKRSINSVYGWLRNDIDSILTTDTSSTNVLLTQKLSAMETELGLLRTEMGLRRSD